MPEMQEKKLLGWELLFEIPDLKLKFGTDEIQQVSLGLDVNSGVPMVKIILKLDTTFSEYLGKLHTGTLTVTNKSVIDDTPSEIFKIELQSITQMERYVRREESQKNISYKPMFFPIKYMCKSCNSLNQKKVGGVYSNKKLEDIIKDLYQQTGCDAKLQLESPDNKKTFDDIFVPQDNFTSTIKNLNYRYGIYNSQLLMFGDTFISNSAKTFTIASVNNIKSEEIKLHNIPDSEEAEKMEAIDTKNYYTYFPININNAVSKIMQQIPKKLNCISFDKSKFFEEKIIDVKSAISKIKFLKSSDQFQDDKNFQFDELLMSCNRQDNFDYTIQDSLQRIASGAIQTNVITIPNPFLMEHWKIGNIINYTSEHQEYVKSDIKFFIFGFLYVWKQSKLGGAWECTLRVRPGAASTVS